MDAGAYALLMENHRERRLTVGTHGEMRFPPGVYVYAGAAKTGLAARIEKHLDPGPKPRNAIDHVVPKLDFTYPVVYPTTKGEGLACKLADRIAKLPDALPVLGVGVGECACLSHLYGFLDASPDPIREALEAWRL
ncbi:MAG TPA: DUF123 domain-containing protein [Candidatus Thermoplasmatota archaeon]|nr:DUF123 domain-containing protein [Candidatus Thermoplasmatota archaeon]